MADLASRPLDARGLAGAVVCCALWGGNAVAVKFSIPDLPPFGCAAIRFLIALPILGVACWRIGPRPVIARRLWGLVVLHALMTAIQIGTFNWGTSHSEAGRSSVFINVHPLIVAPLAGIWFGERLGSRGWLGLASAVAGVALLLWEPLSRGGGLVGDLVVLGSGVLFAFQTLAQKRTFPLIPPMTLLLFQTVLAIPLIFGVSACFEGIGGYQLTPQAIWGVIYQGLAVSGVCFSLWMLLLRRYPAGRLAALAFLTPLFGVGLGHLTRHEPLTWPLVGGGILVGMGIYLVASDRTAHALPPDLALPGEDAP